MNTLKAMDPLKNLTGKLNFLRSQNPQIFSVLKLINSLVPNKQNLSNPQISSQNKQSSLNNIAIEQLKKLSSQNKISDYDHKKMLFQSHVHKHSNLNAQIGTIYQQLEKHQKRLVLTLLKYSDRLNVRQMSYLQYALRRKINALYPSWENMHFIPQSPLRKEFVIMPNITSIQHLYDLKLLPQKTVVDMISATRPKIQKKQPEPPKIEEPEEKGKGKPKAKGKKEN